MNKDQLLHDYIITHSAELTEKWLKLRRKLRGRFYSADQLSEEMKRLLIEQHTFTNTVIASAFWKIRPFFSIIKKNGPHR